jgi:hypothetical protein
VVTAACFLFCTRAMGVSRRPAFPVPSPERGTNGRHISDALRVARMRAAVSSDLAQQESQNLSRHRHMRNVLLHMNRSAKLLCSARSPLAQADAAEMLRIGYQKSFTLPAPLKSHGERDKAPAPRHQGADARSCHRGRPLGAAEDRGRFPCGARAAGGGGHICVGDLDSQGAVSHTEVEIVLRSEARHEARGRA